MRRFLPIAFALVAACPGAVEAQDYSAGKTPAQLFASDCSGCHKSPQGLAKGQDGRSLTNFLREHYTTKPESAGALAAFIVGSEPRSAEPKSKPAAGREKPESSARSRRAESAGGAEAGQKPAPRPRSAAAGSEPKTGEEQRSSVRRPHPAGEAGRSERPLRPADGARPETARGTRPAASAEPRPGGRGHVPTPATKREPERPAAAQPRPNEKLKSYMSSGEQAKDAKTDEPHAAGEVDPKLQGYANSGGGVEAVAVAPAKAPAPADVAPEAKSEAKSEAKPQAEPNPEPSADEPKASDPPAGGAGNRPRRAAAPVEGDPAPSSQPR